MKTKKLLKRNEFYVAVTIEPCHSASKRPVLYGKQFCGSGESHDHSGHVDDGSDDGDHIGRY